MTAAFLVALLALAAVAAVAVRERARRHAAELRAERHEARAALDTEARRRILPVAAHELRSPIAIVLGYQELLADGIYGDLDANGVEALARVRRSAEQLLRLVDGVVELGGATSAKTLELAPVDLDSALSDAIAAAEAYGQAYGVQLQIQREQPLPVAVLDADRLGRALDMTIAGAIKASGGRVLTLTAAPLEHGLALSIAGTGLDPERDDVNVASESPPMIQSGAGLRLAIARRALAPDGTLVLDTGEDGVTVELRVRGGALSD